MNGPWYPETEFVVRRRSGGRVLGSLLLIGGLVAGFYHFDPIGRVAYAVQRGKLNADKEYLAEIAAKDVANLEQVSKAFNLIAETVKPSVVGIETVNVENADGERGRRFGLRMSTSAGSGVLYDANGHVLTSNHVISGSQRIDVTLSDGRTKRARVIGTDRMTDVAVLKIDADRLHPASFGDSDEMQVGFLAFAIGSPFRLSQSVSHGIVSAKGRDGVGLNIDYQDFIQTDVPTNPGNSGGPLVNIRGQVVGINTAIATDSGQFAGVAFAMPSNLVTKIAKRLIAGGKIVRGYLGVNIEPLDPDAAKTLGLSSPEGIKVVRVIEDGPAAKGGLRVDDVVLALNGVRVRGMSQLQQLIADVVPDDEATFKVWRDHQEHDLKIKVGEQPEGISLRGGLRRLPEPRDNGRTETDQALYALLGLGVQTLNPELISRYGLETAELENGAVITRIDSNGEAFAKGLKPGEVIVAVDGERVRNRRDLRDTLTEKKLKEGVKLRVVSSNGKSRTVSLQIE